MSDYSFMRTGQDPVGDVTEGARVQALKLRALALVTSWASLAINDAAVYCSHAHRDVLMLDDIRLAMLHQAMTFLDRRDLEERVVNTEGQLDVIYESDEEDEVEEIEESDADWTASTCTCETCSSLNNATAAFEAWDPIDPAEKVLKSTLKGSATSPS
jgi:hypothetical protein